MKVLGIDFGTTSFSACLYDSQRGQYSFQNRYNSSREVKGRRREFNIKKLRVDFYSFIKDLAHNFDLTEVAALAVTGNMHSFFLVRDNEVVTNIITWQDERALEEYRGGMSYVDYINNNFAPLFSKYQYLVSPGYAVTSLLPLMNSIDIKDCSLHFAPDFIIKELLGEIPFRDILTDHSLAHSSGLYDLENKEWNFRLIKALGYDRISFPELGEPGYYLGCVGKHIPALQGVPVYLGMGDNQASVLGAIAHASYTASPNNSGSVGGGEQSPLVLSIGTSGQVSAVVKEIKVDSKYLDYRPFLDNHYLLVGASLAAGKTIEMLKEFIQKSLASVCKEKISDQDAYQIIENSIQEYSPLHFRTTLNGTRYNPQMRGMIKNIDLNNFTIENLVTAAAYGVVTELYEYYQAMNLPRSSIIGVGNGLQKNDYFINIKRIS